MEGLADDLLRDVLTRIGGYDWCVSEFIRVSTTLLSDRHFLAYCPELANRARTAAGTPVRLQLLGSDPVLMAENAARAASLGPWGIDLNFGCPAPTVNRNRGGAALLGEPELLSAITAAVRRAVPAAMPVTAKMRLGIDDAGQAIECAQALVAGGACELVVHARTRADAYRPPARWEWLARIREAVPVPVIANGDVWTLADWHACRAVSGCRDVMIGRGAVSDPFLARRLRGETVDDRWPALLPLIVGFWDELQRRHRPGKSHGRLKQWLGMLRRSYPQAAALLGEIRPIDDAAAISRILARVAEGEPCPA